MYFTRWLNMSDITALFRGKSTEDNSKTREDIAESLEGLFERLEDISSSNIPDETLETLPVKLEYLDINDKEQGERNDRESNTNTPRQGSGMFFTPWSASRMERYAKNMDSEEVKKDVKILDKSVTEGSQIMREMGGWDTWEWASCMCYRLMWEVEVAPRKQTRDDSLPLHSITQWRCDEELPDDWRFQPEFAVHLDEWYPKYYWVLPEEFAKPHAKVCMYHNADGDPALLLQEELLTIVAVMITRLNKPSLKKHLVFPVMLFSFMGERHGRILLAHFDGTHLVVRKSELYRFIVKPQVSQPQASQPHVSQPQTSRSYVLRSRSLRPRSPLPGEFPIHGSETSCSQPGSLGTPDLHTPESPPSDHSLSHLPSGPVALGPVAEDPSTQGPIAPSRGPEISPHQGIAPVSSEPQSNEPLGREYLDVDLVELFARYLASDVDELDKTKQLPESSAA